MLDIEIMTCVNSVVRIGSVPPFSNGRRRATANAEVSFCKQFLILFRISQYLSETRHFFIAMSKTKSTKQLMTEKQFFGFVNNRTENVQKTHTHIHITQETKSIWEEEANKKNNKKLVVIDKHMAICT